MMSNNSDRKAVNTVPSSSKTPPPKEGEAKRFSVPATPKTAPPPPKSPEKK